MAKTTSGKPTQKEAVSKAIEAGKDSPAEGVPYVKEQFGITINNGAFSTIKSQLKKAAGTVTSPGQRGRPAGTKAGTDGQSTHGRRGRKPAAAMAPSTNGMPNMALQVEAIKTLVETLGVDQVKQLAEIFRK